MRRSWLTARSSAVRIRSPSASASAWAAWVRSRARSRAATACAVYPASSEVVALAACPFTSRARSGRTSNRSVLAPGSGAPLDATMIQRPLTRSRSCAWPPWLLVRWSRTSPGVSAPPSTVWARLSSDWVSRALRDASASRRAARWTTLLTATATVTNSTSASRLRGSAIVNVCSGSVKYQFSSRQAATAANTPGQKPPTTVAATTSTR